MLLMSALQIETGSTIQQKNVICKSKFPFFYFISDYGLFQLLVRSISFCLYYEPTINFVSLVLYLIEFEQTTSTGRFAWNVTTSMTSFSDPFSAEITH